MGPFTAREKDNDGTIYGSLEDFPGTEGGLDHAVGHFVSMTLQKRVDPDLLRVATGERPRHP
jgi:hypothetical protein